MVSPARQNDRTRLIELFDVAVTVQAVCEAELKEEPEIVSLLVRLLPVTATTDPEIAQPADGGGAQERIYPLVFTFARSVFYPNRGLQVKPGRHNARRSV